MRKTTSTSTSKSTSSPTADDVMAAMAREASERAAAAHNGGCARKDRRGEGVVDRRTGLDRRGMEAFRAARAASAGQTDHGVAADHADITDHTDLDLADQPPTGVSSLAGSASTNLERRRGPGRRRTDFMKSADEGEMTQEQFLFIMAIDAFKRVNGKTFPTWTDVLEVIRKLGYRKTMPSELNLGRNTEDWTEQANAPAGVFKEAEED